MSEAIALALLLSHTADDGSFQEDELNSPNRRKKGSKHLENHSQIPPRLFQSDVISVHAKMSWCMTLNQKLSGSRSTCPLARRTWLNCSCLCFGNCKDPQGHILVLAPLLSLLSHASITWSLQKLAHTCLTPCEVPWPSTVALWTHDTMESP